MGTSDISRRIAYLLLKAASQEDDFLKKWKENQDRKEKQQKEAYTFLSGLISPEDRIFFTSKPFKSFHPVEQDRWFSSPMMGGSGIKPMGLWYGCGTSWLDFSYSNDYEFDSMNYMYKVKARTDNMVLIRNENEFDAFTTKYVLDPDKCYVPNWYAVSEDYAGIEINPYLQSRRNHASHWYHPWDVASGCIWGSSGFGGVTLLAYRVPSAKTDLFDSREKEANGPWVKI